jgi:hypothetical protein
MWGLDLLGRFKKAPGGLTHLLITVDKVTKWIEVKPLAKISSMQAVNFIEDIIFCFELPNSIITDIGTQFTGENSWISVMIIISGWTRPRLPTHIHMGRSSALAA